MITIGIDIGFTGAIAFFGSDGKPDNVMDMPCLKVGKKTELDTSAIYAALQHLPLLDAHVFVEKAQSMPGQGIASTGRYLIGYGMIIGILVGLRIPHTLVHPRTWKAKMMRDMEKEKQASVLRCQQLYPEFAAKYLKLKKHHGRADSLLLSHFGWLTMRGGSEFDL